MCIIIMPNYRNYARGRAFVSSIHIGSSDRGQIQIDLSGSAFFHSLLGLTSSMIPNGEIVACSATLQFSTLVELQPQKVVGPYGKKRYFPP